MGISIKDIKMIFTVFELAVFLILPLVFLYSKHYKSGRYLIYILFLYIAWYLTYSLTHELCHLLTAKILQENVIQYQLMPRFWLGQTDGGFVRTLYTSQTKEFLIVLAPYARDLLLSIFGLVLILRNTRSIFLDSFLLMFFISSSLFDVFNNYLAYLLGSLNDFNALGYTSYGMVPHFVGSLLILAMAVMFFLSFRSMIIKKR